MQAVLWLASFIGWRMIAGEGDDKMVGGAILKDISQTPYVVSIHVNDKARKDDTVPPVVLWNPICAGTIFTAVYVLTACHCVVGVDAAGKVYPLVDAFPLENWAFLAGAWDLHIPAYEQDPATQRRTPESIRYHPKCHPERTPWLLNNVPVYDAALAKMSVPFYVNKNVKPANIFSFDQRQFKTRLDGIINDKIHLRCVVAGWGSTLSIPISEALNVEKKKTGSTEHRPHRLPLPTALQMLATANSTGDCTAVPFIDEDLYRLQWIRMQARYEAECLEALVAAIRSNVGPNVLIYWPTFEKTFREKLRNQICAENKNSSPCRGDSGSGLVCDGQFIIGINSFGVGCGTSAPDMFQSVLQVLDWVEKEICSVKTCTDVQHLHSNCDIRRPHAKAIVERCQTTMPPKDRHAGHATDDGILSSVPPRVKTRWLIIILLAITY